MNRHTIVAVLLFAGGLFAPQAVFSQVRLGPRGPQFVKPQPKPQPGKKKLPARPPADPNQPHVFKLNVTPAGEPALPLKYSLLPPYETIQPGNSVPFYYRALLTERERPETRNLEFWENKYDPWLQAPLAQFPRSEVREFLKPYDSMFEEMRTAAHREQTDWSWRLRDMKGLRAISFLMPEMQSSRQLARMLNLKIRLEIAEGRYEDAIESLQIGYKLAKDVGQPPTLINELVGVAIASIMSEEVIQLIGAPDAPNLYWALARLEQPYIDMRPAIRYEMTMPGKVFPSLKEAETADHTPREWGRIVGDATYNLFVALRGGADDSRKLLQSRLAATGLVLRRYTQAKRDLAQWGYDPRRVEQMPVGQVVAIHEARLYRYISQELTKWSYLPYHEVRSKLRRSQEKLKREGYLAPGMQSREIIPLASMLLPAVSAAHEAGVRLDSRIAVLRVVEAVRMHAANNDGKLPATLDDITLVPVPRNPRDNQPFAYRFDGERAVLDLPAPPRQPARVGWRFVITVKKP